MKIVLAADHAGFPLKEKIKEKLLQEGYDILDEGTFDTTSVDYPVYGAKAARKVASHEVDFGIVCCGSGIGISIAANKVKGVRAALCHESLSARLAREHNNANVLALGARMIGEAVAFDIVQQFLQTPFAGERHQRRVDLITEIEENCGK